jgi:hypothetical protein
VLYIVYFALSRGGYDGGPIYPSLRDLEVWLRISHCMVPYLLDRECRDSVPSTTSPGLRWYKKFDPDLELNYQPRIEAKRVLLCLWKPLDLRQHTRLCKRMATKSVAELMLKQQKSYLYRISIARLFLLVRTSATLFTAMSNRARPPLLLLGGFNNLSF